MPIQVAVVGQFAIAAVPGEFTTMAGRRMRNIIYSVMESTGNVKNPKVVVAGLSNIYTDYITTPEEYQV